MERSLRETFHIAEVPHFCDNCGHEILPGHLYQRRVVVYPDKKGKERIADFCTHYDLGCPCDFPEEYSLEDREIRHLEKELKKAA